MADIKMKLVYKKSFGNDWYVPACDNSKLILDRMKGRVAFSALEVLRMKEKGCDIEVVMEGK